MIEINNLSEKYRRLDKNFLKKIAEKVLKGEKIKKSGEISIAIVDSKEIQKLNKQYRKKNKPTDVLSFGKIGSDIPEIVICPEEVEKSGDNFKKEMATFSKNQVRDIIITTAEATESTAKTFVISASAGESRVLKADGSGVPTTTGDFYIINKRSNGDIKMSDIIKYGQVKYFKKQAPVTAVAQKVTVTIPSTITAGDVCKIDIVLDQWGSVSFEDQYFKFGAYKALTGFTKEDIVDGLIAYLLKHM